MEHSNRDNRLSVMAVLHVGSGRASKKHEG